MVLLFAIVAAMFALLAYNNSRVLRRRLIGSDYRTPDELILLRLFKNVLPPLIIVLLAIAYGDPQSNATIGGTLRTIVQLFHETFQSGTQSPYYGTQPMKIWFSIRLMIMAICLSILGGWLLFLFRVLIRQRLFKTIVEFIFAVLESVPDAIYIVLTVVLVVVLVEDYSIVLPAFSDTAPRFVDTWIPAFVLSLPSIFALQRILFLRFSEETSARYIQTARAKGAEMKRITFRHILPNVTPAFLRSLPAIVSMIISSALFVEFFMEYGGQLSYFLQGVGEGATDGVPTVVISGGNLVTNRFGQPEYDYYAGTLLVIGLLLVLFWMMVNRGIQLVTRSLYPEIEVRASFNQKRVRWGSVAIGGVLVLAVILFGVFPRLLTPFKPNYEDLTSSATVPPISPNNLHPLGTDAFGHDFLSMTLNATVPSLLSTAVVTASIVVLSLVLCAVIFHNPDGKISDLTSRVSRMMSALPTLFIVFLVLYPENHVVQELFSHGQPNYTAQAFWFIFWIAVIETGRFSFELRQHIQDWYSFSFVESAIASGRGRIPILFTHLRSWLGRYLLEFSLTEFVRVMSLMAQLGALHIYFQERIGLLPFKPMDALYWPQGLISAIPTWFGMVGDSTMNMSFISYPFYLEGPILALLMTMVGANLIAHGIRGTTEHRVSPINLFKSSLPSDENPVRIT